MDRFGKLVRYYRQRCIDPERGSKLTQERLGELIGAAIGGAGYTGAAVSDWERGKSKIDKDYRSVLVSLVKILHSYGGLKNLTEANTLLQAGNYRSLDEAEKRQAFPVEVINSKGTSNAGWFAMLYDQIIYFPDKALSKFNDLPPGIPTRWGGWLLALLGSIFNRQFFGRILHILIWLGIGWLTMLLTFPMLEWPFNDQEQVFRAVTLYAGATMLLPLGIGILTDTRRDVFWQSQNLTRDINLRFYTYLGAVVGYHVGYCIIFVVVLFAHFLGFSLAEAWPRFVLAAWPVILGAAAAQQIPFNQWRAYGRLRFADGATFLVFYLFGPVWAVYFYLFHSWLVNPLSGIPIVVIVVICMTLLSTQRR